MTQNAKTVWVNELVTLINQLNNLWETKRNWQRGSRTEREREKTDRVISISRRVSYSNLSTMVSISVDPHTLIQAHSGEWTHLSPLPLAREWWEASWNMIQTLIITHWVMDQFNNTTTKKSIVFGCDMMTFCWTWRLWYYCHICFWRITLWLLIWSISKRSMCIYSMYK